MQGRASSSKPPHPHLAARPYRASPAPDTDRARCVPRAGLPPSPPSPPGSPPRRRRAMLFARARSWWPPPVP